MIKKLYGVWHDEQQIARPGIFVVDSGSVVRYAYVGEDFADRPGHGPIQAALAGGGAR
jgi:alkyl hydroperoxide reductase subunit AhpC